jgi:hypothetical protein
MADATLHVSARPFEPEIRMGLLRRERQRMTWNGVASPRSLEVPMRSARSIVSVGFLCLSVVPAAQAQPGIPKIHFGVLGGAAFSKPGGADVGSGSQTYTGWIAGGFVALPLGPGFAIRPEVFYVHKGAVGAGEPGEGTITIRLPYVEVPVLLNYTIPIPGPGIVSPHLYAGPSVAFRTECKVKVSDPTNIPYQGCDVGDPNPDIKRTDFGLTFGGGIGVGRAIIDVRYDLGLTKIPDTANTDVKNRTFYLLAGWTFRTP